MRKITQLFLYVVIGAFIWGCATLSNELKSFGAKAPRKLDSSPTETGLVVLDFKVTTKDVWGFKGSANVYTASIQQLADGSEVLYSGPVYSGGFINPDNFGILFQGLQPGQYKLRTLNAKEANPPTEIELNMSEERELEFKVKAGSLLYIGRCACLLKGNSYELSCQTDHPRELEVWQTIKKKYTVSKWDTIIDDKIESLKDSLNYEGT